MAKGRRNRKKALKIKIYHIYENGGQR